MRVFERANIDNKVTILMVTHDPLLSIENTNIVYQLTLESFLVTAVVFFVIFLFVLIIALNITEILINHAVVKEKKTKH